MRDEGAELMRALMVLRAGRGSKHQFASPQARNEIAHVSSLYDQDSQATEENEIKESIRARK
jgi:hypothetical protein